LKNLVTGNISGINKTWQFLGDAHAPRGKNFASAIHWTLGVLIGLWYRVRIINLVSFWKYPSWFMVSILHRNFYYWVIHIAIPFYLLLSYLLLFCLCFGN